MVELPRKKVGIVACSGEELPEGTVTRLAALRVLEQLRPEATVTICLPLFLAGGEGDRAFARFYPTIAVDGCELRCAARGTGMYSGKPAASVVVREIVAENNIGKLDGKRRLNSAGLLAVDLTAERIAILVDDLLAKHWDRRAGEFLEPQTANLQQGETTIEPVVATCACGSGVPVQNVNIGGQEITLIALPLIFKQLHATGKTPSDVSLHELMETVKIYNPIPAEAESAYAAALLHAYTSFWEKECV